MGQPAGGEGGGEVLAGGGPAETEGDHQDRGEGAPTADGNDVMDGFDGIGSGGDVLEGDGGGREGEAGLGAFDGGGDGGGDGGRGEGSGGDEGREGVEDAVQSGEGKGGDVGMDESELVATFGLDALSGAARAEEGAVADAVEMPAEGFIDGDNDDGNNDNGDNVDGDRAKVGGGADDVGDGDADDGGVDDDRGSDREVEQGAHDPEEGGVTEVAVGDGASMVDATAAAEGAGGWGMEASQGEGQAPGTSADVTQEGEGGQGAEAGDEGEGSTRVGGGGEGEGETGTEGQGGDAGIIDGVDGASGINEGGGGDGAVPSDEQEGEVSHGEGGQVPDVDAGEGGGLKGEGRGNEGGQGEPGGDADAQVPGEGEAEMQEMAGGDGKPSGGQALDSESTSSPSTAEGAEPASKHGAHGWAGGVVSILKGIGDAVRLTGGGHPAAKEEGHSHTQGGSRDEEGTRDKGEETEGDGDDKGEGKHEHGAVSHAPGDRKESASHPAGAAHARVTTSNAPKSATVAPAGLSHTGAHPECTPAAATAQVQMFQEAVAGHHLWSACPSLDFLRAVHRSGAMVTGSSGQPRGAVLVDIFSSHGHPAVELASIWEEPTDTVRHGGPFAAAIRNSAAGAFSSAGLWRFLERMGEGNVCGACGECLRGRAAPSHGPAPSDAMHGDADASGFDAMDAGQGDGGVEAGADDSGGPAADDDGPGDTGGGDGGGDEGGDGGGGLNGDGGVDDDGGVDGDGGEEPEGGEELMTEEVDGDVEEARRRMRRHRRYSRRLLMDLGWIHIGGTQVPVQGTPAQAPAQEEDSASAQALMTEVHAIVPRRDYANLLAEYAAGVAKAVQVAGAHGVVRTSVRVHPARPIANLSSVTEATPVHNNLGNTAPRAVTVDSFMEEQGLGHLDLLRVHGLGGEEPHVLLGAHRTLTSGKVDVLIFEYNEVGAWQSHELSYFVEWLDRLGMDCYFLGSPGMVLLSGGCWDPHYELKWWLNVACVARRLTHLNKEICPLRLLGCDGTLQRDAMGMPLPKFGVHGHAGAGTPAGDAEGEELAQGRIVGETGSDVLVLDTGKLGEVPGLAETISEDEIYKEHPAIKILRIAQKKKLEKEKDKDKDKKKRSGGSTKTSSSSSKSSSSKGSSSKSSKGGNSRSGSSKGKSSSKSSKKGKKG
eukprot:jgi/Mesvir1/13396/Mv16485-RA.1